MTDAMREALKILIDERDRIDRAVQVLQQETAPRGRAAAARGTRKKAAKRRGRPPMSEEARQAVSKRMKAYWAARRKAKAKAAKNK